MMYKHFSYNLGLVCCMYNFITISCQISARGKQTKKCYRETEAKNQIDQLTVQHDAIFETVVYEDPYRGLGSLQNSQLE
jgi:hypothetical protein